MQLLLYSNGNEPNQKRLEAAVQMVIPESQIESFKSLADFGERLRLPVEPDSIAVLSASNLEELQRMQLLRALLTEIYVVLVIPDREEGTIRLAHLLLPRFLSQQQDTFIDLGKVLAKIYGTSHWSRIPSRARSFAEPADEPVVDWGKLRSTLPRSL